MLFLKLSKVDIAVGIGFAILTSVSVAIICNVLAQNITILIK